MRRPVSRKPLKPLVKPAFFPAENVLERALPAHLVGQSEFDQYHFLNFDLTQANLSGRLFHECRFENCNLAGANLQNASLQNVAFEGCKLLGLQFHVCRDMLFGVHFDRCQLDYASFSGRSMPNTRFGSCSLQEVDFRQADLSGAIFDDCNLLRALFAETRLVGADFTTAHGIELNPELNQLQQARFTKESLPGLLAKHNLIIE